MRILALLALVITSAIYPELLIIKKTNGGFAPLTQEEAIKHGPAVSRILLKYQWPMCIASKLSSINQRKLLTPNVPNAEEIFIQEKIKAIDKSYGVIFFPTALYELMTIINLFKTKNENNPLQLRVNTIF